MRNTRNARTNEVADRRGAAADAKAALLQAYKAAKEAAAPMLEAKQAEQIAVAEARRARQAEREQQKRDDKIRIEAEAAQKQAELDAAASAEEDARKLADKNRIARVIEDEAARKAERDRRYANRKARQG